MATSGSRGSNVESRSSTVDACPGALRLFAATDGQIARIRLPGGLITGAALRVLGELAGQYGDGHIEATSRANLQLRGLTDAPLQALARELTAAGLLPSPTHERVRNFAASPASALRLQAGIQELDRAVCADPALAELPGRFLFAYDDGSGDLASWADVAAIPDGDRCAVLFAGVDAGLRVPAEQVVPALVAAAHAFLAVRADEPVPVWRVWELPDGPRRLAARVATALGVALTTPTTRAYPVRRDLVGVVHDNDGGYSAGGLVPLGRLAPAAIVALADAEQLVVTPWRAVLVPGLSESAAHGWTRRLADAGLEATPASPWAGVTACAGLPGCAKSRADVRADATATLTLAAGPGSVHWQGCERGCGRPAGPHVRVEATGDGYDVTTAGFTGHGSLAEVGALVAAARRT